MAAGATTIATVAPTTRSSTANDQEVSSTTNSAAHHRWTAARFVVLQSILVLIAFGVAEAKQPTRPADFSFRASVAEHPAIPGQPFGFGRKSGNARTYDEKIWLNAGGGGRAAVKQTGGTSQDDNVRAGCNLPERLVFLMLNPAIDVCGSRSRTSSTLIDLRLVPHQPISTPGKFTALGAGVDDLNSKKAVSRAVENRARDLGRVRNSIASAEARELEAVIGMLKNPMASKGTRRSLIRFLKKNSIEVRAGAEDPRGRKAGLLEMDDTSHVGEVTLGDGSGRYLTFDLTNSVELRRQLFFDPKSFDILAQRTLIESTTLDELKDWVAAESPEAAIYTETYSKVREVREPRYAQRRVSCESVDVESDGVCIRIGKGGHILVTGG